jgi:hypothetical protein
MGNSRQRGAGRMRWPCAGRATELRAGGLVVVALLGACARFGYQLLPSGNEGGPLGAGGAGFSTVGVPVGGVGNTSGGGGAGAGGDSDAGADGTGSDVDSGALGRSPVTAAS